MCISKDNNFMEGFTLINKNRSKIKEFEPCQDAGKISINTNEV